MPETTSGDIETRLAVAESVLQRLDKQMNGNGKPGMLEKMDTLTEEIRENRRLDMQHVELLHAQNGARMAAIETAQKRFAWIALGVYVAWQFFTGNGTATLKAILEATHH